MNKQTNKRELPARREKLSQKRGEGKKTFLRASRTSQEGGIHHGRLPRGNRKARYFPDLSFVSRAGLAVFIWSANQLLAFSPERR